MNDFWETCYMLMYTVGLKEESLLMELYKPILVLKMTY